MASHIPINIHRETLKDDAVAGVVAVAGVLQLGLILRFVSNAR